MCGRGSWRLSKELLCGWWRVFGFTPFRPVSDRYAMWASRRGMTVECSRIHTTRRPMRRYGAEISCNRSSSTCSGRSWHFPLVAGLVWNWSLLYSAPNESRYEITGHPGLHDDFCYDFDNRPLPSYIPPVTAMSMGGNVISVPRSPAADPVW